jgi:hypothetical protein
MSSKNLRRRMEVMLVEGICALDVAEALLSVDAAAVEQRSIPPDVDVLGVRQAGRMTGYVHLPLDKESGVQPISPEQIVPQTAGLAEVIRVLGDFTCCFVEVLGEVAGLVTREDMEKPPVRMWLFGILTIVETYCSRKLEAFFPDRSWTEHVSPNRLEKAEALQAERKRRGMHTPLVDCMQLSDKLEVLIRLPEMREDFGLQSRSEGKRITKDLEALRNNLAHNQPVAEMSWETLTLMAQRLERILTRI